MIKDFLLNIVLPLSKIIKGAIPDQDSQQTRRCSDMMWRKGRMTGFTGKYSKRVYATTCSILADLKILPCILLSNKL